MAESVLTIRHKKNPFMKRMGGMKTKVRRVTVNRDKAIVDTKTGEMEEAVEVVQVRTVDGDQFVKLFTSNLKQFFNLKPSTYRMVQVLLHQLSRTLDKDQVYLNLNVAERYFTDTDQKPMSKPTFYAALRELVEKEFIAPSQDAGQYWINPSLFFNGDRVRFVKEYRNAEAKQGNLDLEGGEIDGGNPFRAQIGGSE